MTATRKPDILIHPSEGPLVGPLATIKNADDANKAIARLLGRT